jgi:hypothetical protein
VVWTIRHAWFPVGNFYNAALNLVAVSEISTTYSTGMPFANEDGFYMN